MGSLPVQINGPPPAGSDPSTAGNPPTKVAPSVVRVDNPGGRTVDREIVEGAAMGEGHRPAQPCGLRLSTCVNNWPSASAISTELARYSGTISWSL